MAMRWHVLVIRSFSIVTLDQPTCTDRLRDGVPSPHSDIPPSVEIRQGEGAARGAPHHSTVL